MEEVWKVVRMLPDGTFGSALVVNKYYLVYRLGKVTFPKIGKVFAFSKRSYAEKWIGDMPGRAALIRCETSSYRQAESASTYTYESDIESFWMGEPLWSGAPPRGTVFCDDLLPIEVVTTYH